jgi:hypothetical protein
LKSSSLGFASQKEKAAGALLLLVLSAPRRQPQFLINCEKLLHAGATRFLSGAACTD